MRFNDPGADVWVTEAPIEERIVTYADKRATQRVVSLEKRFDRWHRKHPEMRERLDAAFEVARRLETSLCEVIGIQPGQVERLRWVEDAMSRARASGALALADPTELAGEDSVRLAAATADPAGPA